MGIEDLSKNLRKYVEALDSITFDEWQKLSCVMNRSFEKMHVKATKNLRFCPDVDAVSLF